MRHQNDSITVNEEEVLDARPETGRQVGLLTLFSRAQKEGLKYVLLSKKRLCRVPAALKLFQLTTLPGNDLDPDVVRIVAYVEEVKWHSRFKVKTSCGSQ